MKTKTTVKAGSPTFASAATLSDVRTLMVTPTCENPASVYSDKMVCTLDEFPELTRAVREGDLATVSILCAQLFRKEEQNPPQSQSRSQAE